jgi:TrkA domain protein
MVNLTEEEARRIGSMLFGSLLISEKEAVDVAFSALSDLRISVHTYVVSKNLAGKSIGELAIRKKTGVTIIAVSREGKNIINPPPSFVFKEGDIIAAIGESHQLEVFEREILGI